LIEGAAFRGHLECMQFAEKCHFQWTVDVCEQAAHNEHLECLAYA
jgi:hypothetical protein